jgi:hypothetical protein
MMDLWSIINGDDDDDDDATLLLSVLRTVLPAG